jgi:hypothetical protein
VRLIAGALVLVMLLNFAGAFGSGQKTLDRTITTALSGVSGLLAAGQSFATGEFARAEGEFAAAAGAFREAESDITALTGAGAVLATQPSSVQAGSYLTTAGRLIATAGTRFADAAEQLSRSLATWEARSNAAARGESVPSFASELSAVLQGVELGLTELEVASTTLAKVDVATLPADLQNQVASARSNLAFVLEQVALYRPLLPLLPEVLGERVPRRYLLLFQNPDEIRPTGGFIGSIGELTLNDGFVTEFRIRDVYELDGQIGEHLEPPEGFGAITGRWGLRDANYHPDFAVSAAAAEKLYEKGGGGTVDGVVGVTSDLLVRLVGAMGGSLRLPRYEQPVAASDLPILLSLVIESKQDGANAPKVILDEVWEALADQLRQSEPTVLLQVLQAAVAAREVQFATRQSRWQAAAEQLGVAGRVAAPTGSDYLFVVDTSISGNKSDRYMQTELLHETELSGGVARDALTITRTHTYDQAAEARLALLASRYGVPLTPELSQLLGGGRNVDLMKVFVPAGSTLQTVSGVGSDRVETAVDAATGLTYFTVPLTVQPGQSRTVRLSYALPTELAEDYSLYVEQQAGAAHTQLTKVVTRGDTELLREEAVLLAPQKFTLP